MMRAPIVTLGISMMLCAASGAASAIPSLTKPAMAPLAVTHAASRCAPGHVRDASGHCTHAFNRFGPRHHDHFQAYKRKHCKPVHTPNGPVGFCKV